MSLPLHPDPVMAELETIYDKSTNELHLLQQMHTAANTDVPLENILQMVVDGVRNVLNYAACDIYLLEEDGASLRLKALSIDMGLLRMAEKLTGLTTRNMKIPLFEGSDFLAVINTKKAIISTDLAKVFSDFTEKKVLKLLAPKVVNILGLKASIRAPLMVKDKVIGIMGVARKDSITDEDLETLERFASSVALTINKASAQESLKVTNAELKTANEKLSGEVMARKENERKLNISQQRFQHLFENAAVGMVLVDIKGQLVEANHTFARMLGYEREELIGVTFASISHHEDLYRNLDLFDELMAGERDSYQFEKRYITKNKKVVWGQVSAALFAMGEDGQKYVVTAIKDISEQKQAEMAMLESEKKYNLLLDNTDTGFVVVDEKGVVLEANEPYLKFVGANRIEDILGSSVMEWTAPECVQSNADAVALCAQRGFTKDFVTTYLRPDGSRCVIQVDATVHETPSGKRIHAFCRDITERRKAEEAISYSEEIFSKAFKNSPLAMVIGDHNTSEIIDINKQFTELTGYGREEAVGHTPMELGIVSDEDRDALRAVLFKDGFVKNFLMPITTKQGERRILNYFAEPLSMGEEKKILTIAEDVTERRRAERAILESESKFRSYIDHAPSGVFIADANARYVEVNEAACISTGYTRDELLSMSILDIVGSDSLMLVMNSFRKLENKDKVTLEHEYVRKDGTTGWWIVDAVMLGDGRFMGFTTDITQRREIEREIECSLKEKEALLIKQEIRDRELVASRQQLRNLIMHREELLEEERRHISREIHDEMGQQLTALKMDITRLSEMLTDEQEGLLSLTGSMFRAVTNAIKSVQRVSKAIRPVMLSTLGIASAIENEINTFMASTSLQFNSTIEIGESSLDKTVALSLYRILQESITNVARHADATKVDIALRRRNGRIVLEVTDNGRGITREELSAHDAYGLIGMQERANLLNGTLEIKGSMGRGTKLTVSIPAKDDQDD